MEGGGSGGGFGICNEEEELEEEEEEGEEEEEDELEEERGEEEEEGEVEIDLGLRVREERREFGEIIVGIEPFFEVDSKDFILQLLHTGRSCEGNVGVRQVGQGTADALRLVNVR